MLRPFAKGLNLLSRQQNGPRARHDLGFVRLFNLVYVLGGWRQKELQSESMDRWVKTSRINCIVM